MEEIGVTKAMIHAYQLATKCYQPKTLSLNMVWNN